jgi:signal transduction histidine kinase/CheY-like chemotaxis protein
MNDASCITRAITESGHDVMTYLLQDIIEITSCTYGLIGETRYADDGTPYARYHAVHGFPAESPYMVRMNRDHYIDFMQSDTIHSKVYQTKSRIICNNIPVYRQGKPMPKDHPPMKNFALFPLVIADRVIGVVGLSGDNIEMTESWADDLEPQLNTIKIAMLMVLVRGAIENHKINFLINVSQELRTPLNGIISITKMLRDTSLNDEQSELLEIIAHCNIQLLEIINDIVDYTKISMGKLKFNLKPFSLKKCITHITQALKPKLNVALIMDYKSKVELVIGDEVRVTQIILNLLNNSIKFTRSGQIQICIDTEEMPAGTQSVIRFQIIDTGIGIPKDKLHGIFDSFGSFGGPGHGQGPGPFNSFEITDGPGNGVGLGLPITKYLVNAFNGKISVDSEEGIGTTVTFTLKFDNYIQEYSKAELSKYFSTRYVLVITDDPAVRKEVFNWAANISAKPIICGTPEMHMYLVCSLFKFEAIILVQDDDQAEIQSEAQAQAQVHSNVSKVEMSEQTCFKAIICKLKHSDNFSKVNVDYVYADDNVTNALTVFANQVYAIQKLRDTPNIAKASDIKQTVRILISKENQKDITEILNNLGYDNITVASDGLEFYMEIQTNNYDIAFVDLKMPIMDGLTVVKKFREKPSVSGNVVLIAVTASMSEAIRKDCYKAGMNGYITIPLEHSELSAALNVIIRKKISSS